MTSSSSSPPPPPPQRGAPARRLLGRRRRLVVDCRPVVAHVVVRPRCTCVSSVSLCSVAREVRSSASEGRYSEVAAAVVCCAFAPFLLEPVEVTVPVPCPLPTARAPSWLSIAFPARKMTTAEGRHDSTLTRLRKLRRTTSRATRAGEQLARLPLSSSSCVEESRLYAAASRAASRRVRPNLRNHHLPQPSKWEQGQQHPHHASLLYHAQERRRDRQVRRELEQQGGASAPPAAVELRPHVHVRLRWSWWLQEAARPSRRRPPRARPGGTQAG